MSLAGFSDRLLYIDMCSNAGFSSSVEHMQNHYLLKRTMSLIPFSIILMIPVGMISNLLNMMGIQRLVQLMGYGTRIVLKTGIPECIINMSKFQWRLEF